MFDDMILIGLFFLLCLGMNTVGYLMQVVEFLF